jgi:uncharacterized protein (TIGR03083 family)
MSDVRVDHRRACRSFSDVVAQGAGTWTNPSPCSDWDARAVVEHVIGFHDEFLLRPTGTEPSRPADDPIGRWAVTVSALELAMEVAAPEVHLDQLLPALTGEVLAHTWDLAMAIGVDPQQYLDAELCARSYDVMRANEAQVRASGLFGAAVTVPDDSDAMTRFLALSGRDRGWAAAASPQASVVFGPAQRTMTRVASSAS